MSDQNKKPQLKLNMMEPVVVQFQFDEPNSGTGKYGKWYQYGLKVDGKDHVFFTNKKTHDIIDKKNFSRGDYGLAYKTAKEDSDGKTFKVTTILPLDVAKEKITEKKEKYETILEEIRAAEKSDNTIESDNQAPPRQSDGMEEINDEDIPF